MRAIAGLLAKSIDMGSSSDNICEFGKNQLYDGSSYAFITDGEEHLLSQLKQDPLNSFIWNRLGNLYDKGGRPELAASAFEHSLALDFFQVESYYSLGVLLFHIGELEEAALHFRKALVAAAKYDKLSAVDLRDFLSDSLDKLFYIHFHSDKEIPFVPTNKEIESIRDQEILNYIDQHLDLDVEIIPRNLQFFYPIAEIFMGKMAHRIPKKERTWEKPNVSKSRKVKKRHKRTRKK
ncbi:tetratricopeptide repeat protein [Halomonas sp. PAR8]|uniref:tetratricopeptide repeat protein n=1 Tax=Halomonas sp. PAR8 TaxID=3075515 RepID=UPI002886B5A1|nr:tetratricopeptide repeat protein [Halomonas sp. PAR8]MDT0593191.1 tetratricopeptide repeat protein [Halomonas sp. PAR8]